MASSAYGFDDKKLKVSIDAAIEEAVKNIDISKQIKECWKTIYPVGSIYISTVQTNPAAIFGGGEWISFGIGKTLVGVDTTDTDFSSAEKTGGSKNVGQHTHNFKAAFEVRPSTYACVDDVSNTTLSKGQTWNTQIALSGNSAKGDVVNINGDTAANPNPGKDNMPPYITVYMFKRTA